MYGPESSPRHGFEENPVIGYLNLDNPEEKAWFEEMEEGKKEFRKKYPTPESAAEDYYNGYLSAGEVGAHFSDEELEKMQDEIKRLNNSKE
jgi:hypothetical protein